MNIQQLTFRHWRGDIFGGLTAGIVALPLCLAFGVASGMGAQAGLYGAIALGILAALFGGTQTQVSGPTGPMTVVMAGMVASLSGKPEWIFATVVLAGLLQIAFGCLKLGGFIRYMPYPVVSGFMSGIGVIIILLQVLPLMGLPGQANVVKGLQALPDALPALNVQALLLGLTAVALVYTAPKVIKGVPGTLVALIVTTLAAVALKLDVPRIGNIPTGLPSLHLPPLDLAMPGVIVFPALTLSVLGSIDSLLTSLVADQQTRTRHHSDHELIGQGLGNALAGILGGLPGAGATMRTVVNIKSGAKTGLSGAVHGLFLLAVLLGLGTLASHIPLAVLAGILITVGIGIIDYKGIRHFARVPRADTLVNLTVFFMTVFVDLIQAVAVGMVLACLVFAKRMSDMELVEAKSLDQVENDWSVPESVGQGIYAAHLQGALFFGNANGFPDMIAKLPGIRAVVLVMDRVPFLDQSGAYVLSDLTLDLKEKGVDVYVSELTGQPERILALTGIVPGEIPEDHVFPTTREALKAAAKAVAGVGATGELAIQSSS